MKKYLFLCFVCTLLYACKTPLSVTNVEKNTITANAATTEFLGFQNISQNNSFVKDFGKELESQNLAFNAQSTYFNGIDLQNLAMYKTKHRYVSFINVEKHIYRHNDAVEDKEKLEVAGWIVAGITCFTLFPVYVPMFCGADKNVCEISLIGKYQIFIYDTIKKEIVSTIPFEISVTDRYQGQYAHKNTDKLAVDTHYKNIFWNTLLSNYEKANAQMASLPK